jgi:signal transduction histidine kinase
VSAIFDLRTYRALLFFVTALPLGIVAFVLLFTGWTLTLLLCITPLVVPVFVGFRFLVLLAARVEGALARGLLDARGYRAPAPSGPRGFWGSVTHAVTDGAFWKAQAYLLLRIFLGMPLAVGVLTALATALGWIAAPIYYRWLPQAGPEGLDYGIWKVDTLPEALLLAPAGLALLLLTLSLVRFLTQPWGRLADALLGGTLRGVGPDPLRPAKLRRTLAAHAAVFLAVNTLLVIIWALTGSGYFWPEWVLLPTGLLLAIHGWITLLLVRPELPVRRLGLAFAVQLGVSAALGAFLVLIWEVTSHGYFWPIWPLLALALLLVAHFVVVLLRSSRHAEERIDVLTTTRAGAVDAEEAKLRRIERDLHDGAQARLVSLGMSLGMAEEKLETDPAGARELLEEARVGAHEALEELRDLARGIHPPVLADRGLEAAVSALAARSPIRVNVSVEAERPPAAVESAAYFVAAEALANAGKHADPTRVDIRIVRDRGELVVEVTDDGEGGADPRGAGLTGLRRRVEALDGKLLVESPAGGPTTVRAELPCES